VEWSWLLYTGWDLSLFLLWGFKAMLTIWNKRLDKGSYKEDNPAGNET